MHFNWKLASSFWLGSLHLITRISALDNRCPHLEGPSTSTVQYAPSMSRIAGPIASFVQQTGGDYVVKLDMEDPLPIPPALEMVPLIISGPSSNRVDLVFFSDGYVAEERDKFVADALRLAKDVSQNQTFNTVQPLMNFWAAFTPSNESGVGVGGVPKDTPYGLYRDGTELRGVYYAHPEVGRAACDSLNDQCDYPILLGNDPLYGGLGGDFTVITASILNGPLVLRHELGHSILSVGEEYDGGFAYFGHNAAHDPKDITWTHWLSDPKRMNHLGTPKTERSVMAMQAYPWTLLNTTKNWAVDFSSSGTYSRYSLQFSLSGLPQKGDLRVTLDGADLAWEPRPEVGEDRWFYNFYSEVPLTAGKHVLAFALKNPDREGSAQLCSTEILEYGNEEEFVSTPNFYSLYPTFSDVNETSYRPTNDDCLMRLVTRPNFCKVCLETLWIHLLQKINLVDTLKETCEMRVDDISLVKVLSLDLLPLAHLRTAPVITKESYSIIWMIGDTILPHFSNQTRIEIDESKHPAPYIVTAHVKFSTEEIRRNSPATESQVYLKVVNKCS